MIVSEKFPGFKISTEAFHPPVPHLDNRDDAAVVALLKDIGINGPSAAVSYAAEAGQFAEAGFDAVICGPGSIEQAHRADEFISEEQLFAGQEMLKKLIALFS